MELYHDTLVFERLFDATPSKLFSAYVDKEAREKWSRPSPTAEVKIDHSDVRTGGSEAGRCGTVGDLRWSLKIAYHKVETDRLLTFTEELWDGQNILTVALITFDFTPLGERQTKLALTDQITSFVGADVIHGHREGYSQALINLDHYVTDAEHEAHKTG